MPPGKTNLPDASRTRDAFCIGRSLPIAAILPPVMPTSATYESVAVTTVPLRMIRSKLITASVRKEQGTMLHCRPSVLHNQVSARKEGSSHAIRHHAEARYLHRAHRRLNAAGRARGIRVRLDFRFSCLVERALPAAHAYGNEHEADAAGYVRHQSRDARSHGDGEPLRDSQSYLWGANGTRNRARRQFAAGDGEKAGDVVAVGSGREGGS